MSSTQSADRILRHAHLVREPAGIGQGYWAGAPGVFYARDEKAFYLTYRLRRPRGVAPDRGGEARIARSVDLRHFEDIWSTTKAHTIASRSNAAPFVAGATATGVTSPASSILPMDAGACPC